MRYLFWLIIVFLLPCSGLARSTVSPEDAVNYVSTKQTVCGKVVDTKYLSEHPSSPTFLNLNEPYPVHVFTAVIWGKVRDKFDGELETDLMGKDICVTGKIREYRGRAEVFVEKTSQIELSQ